MKQIKKDILESMREAKKEVDSWPTWMKNAMGIHVDEEEEKKRTKEIIEELVKLFYEDSYGLNSWNESKETMSKEDFLEETKYDRNLAKIAIKFLKNKHVD